jgi:putative flippase GtrA
MGSEKRNFLKEFIIFNIVGVINTIITYGIYSFFVFLGIDYRLALFMEYCLGVVFSFFLHRKFTFRHTGIITMRMVFSMIASYLVVLGINMALLIILVEKFSFNEYIGQIIALTVSVAISFLAQKYLVFQKKPIMGGTGKIR